MTSVEVHVGIPIRIVDDTVCIYIIYIYIERGTGDNIILIQFSTVINFRETSKCLYY